MLDKAGFPDQKEEVFWQGKPSIILRLSGNKLDGLCLTCELVRDTSSK